MKIFPIIKKNPEMVFDDQFYAEQLRKKSEFENLSFEEQYTENTYSSEMLNSEISYNEVSDAISSTKKNKAFLEIPNEAFKNVNGKLLLHRFLCLNPTEWDYSDIKPSPKKGKGPKGPLAE